MLIDVYVVLAQERGRGTVYELRRAAEDLLRGFVGGR